MINIDFKTNFKIAKLIQNIISKNMKANKTRSKEITKTYVSKKSMHNENKFINLMVFSIVFFIAVLLISQIV